MSHDHDHDHPEFLAHHWDTPKQQFEAGKLGMWLFLATEVLFFGGLFCAYALWRFHNPEMFKFGSQFLDTKWGAINTAVLIASSGTMAVAVTMAQRGKIREMLVCLVLTLAGAVGFLGIKYVEYTHKFHEGYYPGMKFYTAPDPAHAHSWTAGEPVEGVLLTTVDPAARAVKSPAELGLPEDVPVELPQVGPSSEAPGGLNMGALEKLEARYGTAEADAEDETHAAHEEDHGHGHEGPIHPLQDPHRPKNAHMFFNIYFMMTGLHGVHVLVGVGVIAWIIILGMRGRFSADYFTPVDLVGLYWHVVDLIWIFLFPLFYLI